MAAIGYLEEDPYLKYSCFRARPHGKVACLALGNDLVGNAVENQGTITEITFQKVDKGIVRPVMRNDQFVTVNWPNAPTRDIVPPNLFLDPAPAAGVRPAIWDEFVNTMRHAKNAIINQMTDGIVPRSLLQGIQNNAWRGGPQNKFDKTGLDKKCCDIQNTLRNTGHWSNNTWIEDFIQSLLGGLYNGTDCFKNLIIQLLPECRVFGKKGVVLSPAETSKNASIRDGVTHCLVYGFHETQLRGRRRTRRTEAVDDNTQLTHRVLLPKELGLRARSRSRSPVPNNNNVDIDSTTIVPPEHQPDLDALLRNPDNYRLRTMAHHHYFEPHKPDMLFFEVKDVEDPDIVQPDPPLPPIIRQEVTAKLVCELSAWHKFTKASLETHVDATTEQLVQSCLAGFAANQEEMFGLALVVDGIKLVRISKQQQPSVTYNIQETGLITWEQSDELLSLLHTLRQVFI